jgi:hypothetical protein
MVRDSANSPHISPSLPLALDRIAVSKGGRVRVVAFHPLQNGTRGRRVLKTFSDASVESVLDAHHFGAVYGAALDFARELLKERSGVRLSLDPRARRAFAVTFGPVLGWSRLYELAALDHWCRATLGKWPHHFDGRACRFCRVSRGRVLR